MEEQNLFFVFKIDERRFAVALSAVEKVIRAVELVTVPKAPDTLLGLLNMKGAIIPVINIRKHLFLPDSEMGIDDRIVIVRVTNHSLAFIVDSVEGVADFSGDSFHQAPQIFPDMEQYIEGVGKSEEKTTILLDIYKLFSVQVIKGLDLDMADA